MDTRRVGPRRPPHGGLVNLPSGNVRADLLRIERLALGLLPLSVTGRPDAASSIAVLRRAADLGIQLFDLADAYHVNGEPPGYSETLAREAFGSTGYGRDTLLATKGGLLRHPDGRRVACGRPDYLKSACERSLRRLGRPVIDLYFLHRPDPAVPWEESVGALAQLHGEGKIRGVGLCNVDSRQLEAAHRTLPEGALVAVQNELSYGDTTQAPVLESCRHLGIHFLAAAPFGGLARAARLAEGEPALFDLAQKRQVSPYRIALAWIRAQGPEVIPVFGARRTESLDDSVESREISLSAQELGLLKPSSLDFVGEGRF